jgi:integrase
LGDIATLTRQNLDLEREEVKLKTDKTGRLQILPLAGPLLKYVKTLRLPAMIPPHRFSPAPHAVVQRQGRTGNLSNQFHKILVAAGLGGQAQPSQHRQRPQVSREQNEISFHSLRHTATTLLKAAGVSDAVAREFIGHDSPTVSNNIPTFPPIHCAKPANKLPDIFK